MTHISSPKRKKRSAKTNVERERHRQELILFLEFAPWHKLNLEALFEIADLIEMELAAERELP